MLRRTGRAPLLGRAAAAALATPPAQVEKGTLAGLLAGFALLSAAILLGGSAASFIDVPSLLIVAGGTLAVVTMCFSRADVQTMLRVVASTIASASPDPTAAAVRALELAERARSRGVLYLEQLLEQQAELVVSAQGFLDGGRWRDGGRTGGGHAQRHSGDAASGPP